MNKKSKKISAYMTVENSLLFPIIISLLMCIIYLVFYSYNSTIAFQNAAICALYGKSFSYTETEGTNCVDTMYAVLERLNQGQYIALDCLNQQVKIEGNHIVVKQEGNVNIPLLNPEIMSQINFSEGVSVNKQNAVFYMRQIRKVKNYE